MIWKCLVCLCPHRQQFRTMHPYHHHGEKRRGSHPLVLFICKPFGWKRSGHHCHHHHLLFTTTTMTRTMEEEDDGDDDWEYHKCWMVYFGFVIDELFGILLFGIRCYNQDEYCHGDCDKIGNKQSS